MGRAVSWATGAVAGFGRACVVLAVTMAVPAVWGAAAALTVWWGSPWAGIAPLVWACLGTVALSRPVCRVVRSLVARWTGTDLPAGYRRPEPVVRMANGFWWNGFSYARSAERARDEQRWRVRWSDPATWRDLRFVAVAPVTAGVVAAVPLVGVASAVFGAVLGVAAVGVPVGLLVAVASAPYAWRVLGPVAVRFLGATPKGALVERVDQLTAQRADLTVAQAAEIRRIERDLHDGAQARLVGLGLSLATAEKLLDSDPARAKALLRQARAGAALSLAELRDLVRGISPPVLTERGLVDAVRALALDSALETDVDADVGPRPDPPVEAAVYFGVAELLTNAVKHARASRARISLGHTGTDLIVVVEDDGLGGAEVRADGGLAGLRRRLAVFDATLELDSPSGGPTRARMVVPCASS
ncbi:histidine kinase [Actinosynnema sp. NPDC050436]|uniref:sensor histidine kinase n=1 Tax=Actinosynnema sp. NPDC050436 TaxID=3155659 RepID=UPI003401F13F